MESANSNALKTLSYVQSKKPGTKVYIQGLIALSVFFFSSLIVIFIYIPYINTTNSITEKRKELEATVESLQVKYDTINNYSSTSLSEGLSKARYFIPDSIRVAQLATFINSNAEKYELTVSRLGINEDQTEVKQADSVEQAKLLGSNKTEKKIYLGRVEGPFSFRGTRENIFRFLDFLVTGGYATNFDQVLITSSEKSTDWSISLIAAYYYLEPLVKVEPGRVLIPVQEEALKPIVIAPTTVAPSSVTPTPTLSPTVTP